MDFGQFLKPSPGYPQGKCLEKATKHCDIWEESGKLSPECTKKEAPKSASAYLPGPPPASCVCCCCCATRVKSSEALDDEQRTRE